MLSVLAAGTALPTATASADTATRYVDIKNASCSDAEGGPAARPYCTLQAAADAAQPGDTVHVASGGTYPATTVTHSGSPGAPITITGANFFSLAQLVFSDVHDVVVRDLQLDMSAGGVQVRDSTAVTLEHLHVGAPKGAAAVEISGGSSDVSVRRSYLYTASASSDASLVKVGAGVRRTVITTNEIGSAGNTALGMELDGAIDTAVTGNTFDPAPHALTVSGGSTGTTVENNALYASDVRVTADSVAQSTVAYNIFFPRTGGSLYDWAGTVYTGAPAFQAATGQGRMDIVGPRTTTSGSVDPWPSEGSAAIDSADADAPGELTTDIDGRPRVDDPLVKDTGNGAGHHDRGAHEFQNPFHSYSPSVAPYRTAVGHPVTVTSKDWNPWGLDVPRTYDFGDGTAVVSSTADSVQHTYNALTDGKATTYRITVTEAGKTYLLTATISPLGPLVPVISARGRDPGSPLDVVVYDGSSSPFVITSCKADFGDGTPPVVVHDYSCGGLQHSYSKAGAYTITATETDMGGRSANTTTKITVGPVFVSVDPTRILDTRTGNGAPKARVGPGGVVHLKVNGAGGVGNATSVLLNLTVAGPTGGGFLTAYPSGTKRPTASSLNFRPGQTVANLTAVPVGADGGVDLYNSAGYTDVIADLEGYNTLTPGPDNATVLVHDAQVWGEFRSVLDTRGDSALQLPKLGKVGAGKSLTFRALLPDLHNVNQYEHLATSVVLNVTVTNATAPGFITAYKPGSSRPNASNLNFAAGETRSAMVVVPVDQGMVTLYNFSGSVDLLASVEGFYLPFGPSTVPINKPMNAINPARVLDTRSGVGARKGPLTATGKIQFKAAGVAGIPAGATGVLVNLTAVNSTTGGYLTVWGDLSDQPSASALNFMRGQVTPLLTYLPISHGYVGLYNPYGSVDVIADVQGYSMN